MLSFPFIAMDFFVLLDVALNVVEFRRIPLDCFGLHWIALDCVGLHWIVLNCIGLCWVALFSLI